MSTENPLDLQTRWADAVNASDYAIFDEIISPAIVDHDPAPGQGPGPGGFVSFFKEMRAAFSDLTVSGEHAFTSGDEVAIAYTLEGTHDGPFLGIPATGKRVRARGMQIARFENGKAVERWGSSDELGILKQIGAKIGPG